MIERTKKEIIFRIPNDINNDDLQDFTDYLRYKEITKNSQANQTDIDTLVKEVKKGRQRFLN